MPIHVAETIAAMKALGERVDGAVHDSVGDIAHIIQARAIVNAPVGVAGNSTNSPGDLARSIDVQGPLGGGGTWEAQVGPTVIYGRQRELGGAIFPQAAAALAFTKFGTRWVIGPDVYEGGHNSDTIYLRRPGVYQHPEPYMKPAEMESRDDALAVTLGHVSTAILAA